MINNIIVQKYGGTSVATVEHIQNVADKIAEQWQRNKKLIIVVSAMAGVTNQLMSYCLKLGELNSNTRLSEYDAALCNGENITAALMALALQQRNIPAKSLQAWQIPIITTSDFSKGLIFNINQSVLYRNLEQGIVSVIAGFQGVTLEGRITTLGRGGSDITAVAIAAAIKARLCEIYTDVSGVFSADPRLVPQAYKIDYLSYEEMLEFAYLGAKVLHPRSVEIAMNYNIPLHILSSYTYEFGTTITNRNKSYFMEKVKITGIALSNNIAFCRINYRLSEYLSKILHHLKECNVTCQNLMVDYITYSMVFNILLVEKDILDEMLKGITRDMIDVDYQIDTDVVLISLVGCSLGYDIKIVQRVYELIAILGLEITGIYTSLNRISIALLSSNADKVVKFLHQEFLSDKKQS